MQSEDYEPARGTSLRGNGEGGSVLLRLVQKPVRENDTCVFLCPILPLQNSSEMVERLSQNPHCQIRGKVKQEDT
jgi:hypothetical protein